MTWGKRLFLFLLVLVGAVSFSTVQADERPAQPSAPYADSATWNAWGDTVEQLNGNVIIGNSGCSTRTFAAGTASAIKNYTLDGGNFVIDGATTDSSNGKQALKFNQYTSADISNVTFQNCYASKGAAIYGVGNNAFTFSKGVNTFTRNTYTGTTNIGFGQAIYISGDNGSVTFTGGQNTFSENLGGGSAILCSVITFIGGQNKFSENASPAIRGDTILFSGGENTFTGNKYTSVTEASGTGGAVYSYKELTVSGGVNTFTNNANKTGGAIASISNMTISGGTNTFSENAASSNGGAIYSYGNLTLSGGTNTFSGNKANSYGGAVYCYGNITFSGGKNTFVGNTQYVGTETESLKAKINNDIYWSPSSSDAEFAIQGGGEYYFGGGIQTGGSGSLTFIKGSATSGPSITFGPGSYTSIGVPLTISDTNLTIHMGTAPESLREIINENVNTTTPTSFYAKTLTASGNNTLTVYATITEGTQTVISSANTISDATLQSFTRTVILNSEGTEGKYAKLTLSSDSKALIVSFDNVPENAPVFNMETTSGGNTINAAFQAASSSANQDIVICANAQETQTTVLNNDSEVSKMNLHSNTETERTVNSPVAGDGKTLLPTLENTTGETRLTVSNINFEGYALNAGTKSAYLSGKNITMNHKSGELDSDQIVTAGTFYLVAADVTFGSEIDADMITDTATKMTIGVDSTKADTLTVERSLQANGTTINMDLFDGNSSDFMSIGTTAALDNVTFNFADNGVQEGNDYTLLTAGSSLTYSNLSAIFSNYAGDFAFYKDGNSLKLKLLSSSGTGTVPEPSTWALLILGVAGLLWYRRKK